MLDALEARDLIRHEPRSRVEGDREFGFKHILNREVAYWTLPRAARRESARGGGDGPRANQVGDNRTSRGSSPISGGRPESSPSRRVPRDGRGARQQAFAKDEALALYDEAIALAGNPADGDTVALEPGALSLIELADFEAGAAELDELTPGPRRARSDRRAPRPGSREHLARAGRRGFAAADRARDLAEAAGDAERTAPAIGYLAGMHTLRGEIDESIARGEEALRRWLPGTRASDFATANEFLADSYYWSGSYERSRSWPGVATEVGGQTQNVEALLRGGGWRGVSLAAMGRTEEALEASRPVDRDGREDRSPAVRRAVDQLLDPRVPRPLPRGRGAATERTAIELVRREGQYGMPGCRPRST